MIWAFVGWAGLALGGVSLIGWLTLTGRLDGGPRYKRKGTK